MSNTSNRYLLISDVDDTLLGDDLALLRFQDFFAEHCADEFLLAYASGRFYDSILEDVHTTELPEPCYIIGGVGSEIRSLPDGEPDGEWQQRMSENWSAARVREIFESNDHLALQPEESQSEFKVSYLYPGATRDHLDRLRNRLAEAGIEANVIYSSNRDLDILPKGVDKGSAGKFVAERLGIPPEHVITAGNSGNDIPLLGHGFKGIIVANAHLELREVGKQVHAYQSPERHADGVRDGLEHWLKRIRASHD
ncbi:MAG: HAD-IIB family hydrolase [Opitutales bacterium]